MVLRVVRFRVAGRVEPAFLRAMRERAVDAVGVIDGLFEVRLARHVSYDEVIVLGTALWQDYESLSRYYRPEVDPPRLLDEDDTYIESATVEHFEDVFALALGRASRSS